MSIVASYTLFDRKASANRQGKYSYTRSYRLEGSTDNVSEADALDYVLANVDPVHPGNSNAIVESIEVRPENPDPKMGRAKYWLAEVVFSTPDAGQGGSNRRNPLERRATFQMDSRTYNRPFLVDLDGKPIATTAGEPLATEPRITGLPEYQLSGNFANMPGPSVCQYVGACNSDTFLGCPPKSLLCSSIRVQDGFEYNTAFFVYTMGFMYTDDPLGWEKIELYNAGTYVLSSEDGRIIQVVDGNGDPIREPVLINEEGTNWLDENGEPIAFEAAHKLEFRKYRQLSFGAIGFILS